MAEPIKPTEKPNFATGGAAVYATPPAGIQDSGWSGPPQKPPFEWFNWLHRFTAEWIAWFEAKIDLVLGGQADESVVLDSSGVATITQTNVVLYPNGHPSSPLAYQVMTGISSADLDDGRIIVIHKGSGLGNHVIEVVNEHAGAAGDLRLNGKRNAILSTYEDYLILQKVGGVWFEVARNIRRESYNMTRGWIIPPRLARVLGEGRNKNASPISPVNNVGILYNAMAFDGTRMWFNSPGGTRLRYMFPGSNVVHLGPDYGYPIGGLHWDGVNLWVSLFNQDQVVRVRISDTGTNTDAIINVGDDPGRCDTEFRANGDRFVWVPCKGDNTLKVIDASTNAVVDSVASGDTPSALLFDGQYVWVANLVDNDISKVDPVTRAIVTDVAVGNGPTSLDYDGVFLYVANNTGCSVSIVDPVGAVVLATVSLGADEPDEILCDGRYAWVVCSDTDKLYRIDPFLRTAVDCSMGLATQRALGFDGRMLWVSTETTKVARVVY